MASFFQQQACNTRLILSGVVASWLLLCNTATAQANGDEQAETSTAPLVTLQPYSASYKTTARGMNITLKRELKQRQGNQWVLTNGGKILVAGFHEQSMFTTEGDRIIPDSYVYQGTGIISRQREVHFTPGSDTVRSLYKEQWYELPNTDSTLDRLSQQEQLRLILLNAEDPKQDIEVTIADGKRVKEYLLQYKGDETLQTAIGPVSTLHFARLHDDPDRSSEFWLAPQWDYLMVRTLHVDDNKPVEAVLTAASIAGTELKPLAE